MQQNPIPRPPPGAVTLTTAEVDALCHVLDFSAGLLSQVDPGGSIVLDETAEWLRDRANQHEMVVLDLGRPS